MVGTKRKRKRGGTEGDDDTRKDKKPRHETLREDESTEESSGESSLEEPTEETSCPVLRAENGAGGEASRSAPREKGGTLRAEGLSDEMEVVTKGIPGEETNQASSQVSSLASELVPIFRESIDQLQAHLTQWCTMVQGVNNDGEGHARGSCGIDLLEGRLLEAVNNVAMLSTQPEIVYVHAGQIDGLVRLSQRLANVWGAANSTAAVSDDIAELSQLVSSMWCSINETGSIDESQHYGPERLPEGGRTAVETAEQERLPIATDIQRLVLAQQDLLVREEGRQRQQKEALDAQRRALARAREPTEQEHRVTAQKDEQGRLLEATDTRRLVLAQQGLLAREEGRQRRRKEALDAQRRALARAREHAEHTV